MREDQMGEVKIVGENGVQRIPTYTCGHCSRVVMLNPERTRERLRCKTCGKLLCEQSELCRIACTPIHALARDRFEADPKWTRLVGALMAGARTEEEAIQRGLIKT